MINSHGISHLYYHFVFVTKKRQNFPSELFVTEFLPFLSDKKFNVIELNTGLNHLHLLIELHPSVSPSKFSELFKTKTSKFFFNKFENWPGWRSGYYVRSVSEVDYEVVIKYIKNQDFAELDK